MPTEIAQLKQIVANLSQEIKSYENNMLELRRRSDIQNTLNEMLNISLMPIPLTAQMERILLLVLNLPWLALDKKGCVFLTDDSGTGLQMAAQHNLGESLLTLCEHIQFGQCLCGKAAVQQTLVFRNCIDDDHDVRPEGMQPHGHYNMPIMSDGRTLGVLNLYVKHGHSQTPLEEEFLSACSKAMASIIERKKIEEQLHKISHTDELTGISNRRHFMNYLDELIIESKQYHRKFAVLFIDLDRFKAINDTYGHEYGDQVLIEASHRMQKTLRGTDLVARLGGDEFVVNLEGVSSADKAIEIAKQLIQSISQPYSIKKHSLTIGASIGISLYPEHGVSTEELLKRADLALYQAKDKRGEAILYAEANLILKCITTKPL
jgi:diguanylate cyclase (GGDEF)-like protein